MEEADPEISEAIDYARWYGSGAGSLERLLADVDGEAGGRAGRGRRSGAALELPVRHPRRAGRWRP